MVTVKEEIMKNIAKQIGIEKSTVKIIIGYFLNTVMKHIIKKERVNFSGFGAFAPKRRGAKTGRIISQNKSVKIPAHYTPVFKPSGKFKEKVKISLGKKVSLGNI